LSIQKNNSESILKILTQHADTANNMEKTYIEDEKFENIDFSQKTLPEAEYDNCQFVNCDFSNSDLFKVVFSECEFNRCNLSMAKLEKTAVKDIQFKECKLLGVHFETCDEFLFAVRFENCLMNLASFYKRKLKKTKFVNCSLQEADFAEADLGSSVFDNCDLAHAIFQQTNLEKADFRTSYNYSIDPELNKIKKAKFSIPSVTGLLDKYDIEIE